MCEQWKKSFITKINKLIVIKDRVFTPKIWSWYKKFKIYYSVKKLKKDNYDIKSGEFSYCDFFSFKLIYHQILLN